MMRNAEEASLSPRQAEIAELVLSGKSSREIALALALSPRTVESHITAIYNKFGVNSRAEFLVAVLGAGTRLTASSVAASSAAQTNLPARRGRLLGRETDAANVTNLVRESRTVTLTGAGGVGKTQLALTVGRALAEHFADGVWFVELAPLARGSPVEDAVVRALRLERSSGDAPIEPLPVLLRRKSLVLILDNCEHVIAEVAALVDALVRDCPHLHVLATSRESLRIAGEHSYRLPSLPVPAVDEVPALDAARGAAYASIELFCRRAQAADYAFALTDDNVRFVAQICRRIDGIPLAIELAAARVNILPLRALATKLESHLRILGGVDRIALARHQTMRALIDWSYDLLEPREQRFFERLSVFAGGGALPQAIAVNDDQTLDELDALEILSSLVEKSLVVVDATGPQPRYSVLQTFAQYGLERLAERGDLAAARRGHAVAYAELAEHIDAQYDLAPDATWHAAAESELENWRAALGWTLDARHDVPLGQRLVAAMRPVWLNADGPQRWLRLAGDLLDERTPPAIAAAVQYATVHVDVEFGALEPTIATCRRLGKVYGELGDSLRVTALRTLEAAALFLLGRASEAQPLLALTLNDARRNGWPRLLGDSLGVAAQIDFARGDVAGGRGKCAEAIAIYESIGARRSAAVGRLNLAEAEFGCSNLDEAMKLAASSFLTIREGASRKHRSMRRLNLAEHRLAADRGTDVRDDASEAALLVQDRQDRLFFLVGLQHVASVAASARGDVDATPQAARAARLLGYTDACLARLGYVREPGEQREYERVFVALGERLPDDRLASLFRAGAAQRSDQALELALSIIRGDPPA